MTKNENIRVLGNYKCARYKNARKKNEHRRYGSNLFFYSRREFITDQDDSVRNAYTRKFSTDSFVTYDGINFITKEKTSLLARKRVTCTPLALR